VIVAAVICSLLACVAAVVVAARRRPATVLPFGIDAPRALLVGAALVAAALAVAVSSFAAAPRSQRQPVALGAGTTMLVVDLSGSIGPPEYTTIRKTLFALGAQRNRHAGLVFFSDSAAEVLPPQTPAAELREIARFFGPAKPHALLDRAAGSPSASYAGVTVGDSTNPWMDAFEGGTSIFRGLDLARTTLERVHARGGQIVLISDLADGGDVRTRSALLRIAAAKIQLRVVGLEPTPQAKQVYLEVFGPQVFVKNPKLAATESPDRPEPAQGTRRLVPAATLAIVLLGAFGCWLTPLRLRQEQH
jgi:hypothetical protein